MRFVWLLVWHFGLLSSVLLLTHGEARAQPTPADRVLATDLFQRGRAALLAGAYPEACPLLEESQRLDPAGGTLLNLALCHEQIGRTASAWSEFLEGLSIARREHREDRIKYASEHIAGLEQRLSRLTVKPTDADLPGLTVERDGTPLRRSAWGVATPVDPGEHSVTVRAPGYLAITQTVTVRDHGDLVTLELPALAPAPVAEPSPAPVVEPDLAPVPDPVVDPAPVAPAPVAAPPRAPLRRKRAAIALLAFGAGAALAATVCGVRALQLRDQAERKCSEGRCSDGAFERNERARRNADASTTLAVVSGLSAGAGLWLWLAPAAGPSRVEAGVGLRGQF